jgi:hypothetical protein
LTLNSGKNLCSVSGRESSIFLLAWHIIYNRVVFRKSVLF